MTKPKTDYEVMIKRILDGDKTVLNEYSRWEVEVAFKSGKLRKAPLTILPELLNVIDSCKESK